MMFSTIDRRVLGAMEFVDAVTGARIRTPLSVNAPGLTLRRNPSDLYVIFDAEGFGERTHEFYPPTPTPALETAEFGVEIADPAGAYLPRRATISLLRSYNPVAANAATKPKAIKLYASVAMPLLTSAAIALVQVVVQGSSVGVANVVVVVSPQLSGVSPVKALTDKNGEALVAVMGVAPILPASHGGGGPVLTRVFDADVALILDDDVVRRSDATEIVLADPDLIELRRQQGNVDVTTLNQADLELSTGVFKRVVYQVVV